jgi:ribosomal-protein-alanine N-acetyltransferase
LKPNWEISILTAEDVEDILDWRYAPPYDLYNLSGSNREALLAQENRYHAVREPSGRLVGYCCFGMEARVPGGEYPQDGDRTLDVGVGLHPELVGQGFGEYFVSIILAFASSKYRPERFRVTVAVFNQRSLKTFQGLGFAQVHTFQREPDGMTFIQSIRGGKDQVIKFRH